jgi:hypothetical protein
MKKIRYLTCEEESQRDEIFLTEWDYGVGTITPIEWFYRYEPLIGFHGEYLGIL